MMEKWKGEPDSQVYKIWSELLKIPRATIFLPIGRSGKSQKFDAIDLGEITKLFQKYGVDVLNTPAKEDS